MAHLYVAIKQHVRPAAQNTKKQEGIVANYHLTAKTLSRSRGQSAVAAAAYRASEHIEEERTGTTHDYIRKRGVDRGEIMLPRNAPDEYADRATLWNAVENKENRKDSQLAREVEVSLPIELTLEQNKELIRSFAREQFVEMGMIVDPNFHNMKTNNPHCHMMLTMREVSKIGFGKKNREWNDKRLVEQWRKKWAEYTNKYLKYYGHDSRIDHRSYEAQGLNKIPTRHLGPVVSEMERRGIKTKVGNRNRIIKTANELQQALDGKIKMNKVKAWRVQNTVSISEVIIKSFDVEKIFNLSEINKNSSLIRFWKSSSLDDGVVQFRNRNGTIVDMGNKIIVTSNNHKLTSKAVVELALDKGWSNIVYEGNDNEYKDVLKNECEERGIEFYLREELPIKESSFNKDSENWKWGNSPTPKKDSSTIHPSSTTNNPTPSPKIG